MNAACSLELLTSAVALTLSPDDESALHAHLESCDACCARLDELAGGESWLQETATLLRGDELDGSLDGSLDDSLPEPQFWSEVDFSVEHLEPSENAGVLGTLGGYDIVGIVGRGGMGVVLKAFDRELKRFVAMKVLAPHLAHSSVARKRFAREAQAAAAVVHPHVIAIHQVQPTGRLPFLVMPLLAGESLAQRLRAQGPLALTEVLRIGMQTAAGLAAAHDQGIVHRDVKPANIFLEKGVERVVITDFGLARAADDVSMTRQGVVAGTPEYMSPEQARGEALDGRSDLFSLGCVLYEMATGVSPFRADSTIATLRRIVEEKPAAMASLGPELPPWFTRIVERLLAKDPADRYSSAREVGDHLEACLSHLQQPTTTHLPALLAGKPQPASLFVGWSGGPRRKAAIGLILIAAFAALAMMLLHSTEPPDIAGAWTGDEWGQIELVATQPGAYEGTYSDTFGEANGELQLKWSRIERRFNGTWKEGKERFGTISVRLVDDQIRGAWTTSKKSEVNPATPKLADLLWKRSFDRHTEPRSKPAALVPDALPVDAPKVTTKLGLIRRFAIGQNVWSIAISADGQRIAITKEPENGLVAHIWKIPVEILSTRTGAVEVSMESFDDSEAAILGATEGIPTARGNLLAFSPDGNVLAMGNALGQVKLFDALSGERLLSFDDETGKRADTASPAELKSLARAMGDIKSLAFSPDGRYLAACGDSFHDAARNWGGVRRLGRLVNGPGRLKVWEVASGRLLHDLAGHSHARGVAFSSDGSLLASVGSWDTGSEHGSGVLLWNSKTGEKVRTLPTDTNGGAWSVAFSPNGMMVAIVSLRAEKDTETLAAALSLFHAGTGIQEWTRTVGSWGHPITFMPDGQSIAMLYGNQSIRFYEAETGSVLHEICSQEPSQSGPWINFAISPSGPTIAIGCENGAAKCNVEVWSVKAESAPAATGRPNIDTSNTLRQFEGDWNIEPDETRSGESRYEGVFCFRRGSVLHLAKGKIPFTGKFTIDPSKSPATFLIEREKGDFARGFCYLHGAYEFRPDGALWLEIPDTDVRPGASITQPKRLLKLRRPGDDRMQGDWVLESVSGRGLRAMEPGLKVDVNGSDWTIHRAGGKTSARLTVNPYIQPSTIDMKFLDENAETGVSRGLYRIEGDILQLFWSPNPEVRPGSYGDPDISIHTYHRPRGKTPADPATAN